MIRRNLVRRQHDVMFAMDSSTVKDFSTHVSQLTQVVGSPSTIESVETNSVGMLKIYSYIYLVFRRVFRQFRVSRVRVVAV